MPYHPTKHGRAEYGSFYQLSLAEVAALQAAEGLDNIPLSGQYFARVVYNVNGGGGGTSGGVAGIVGLDDSGSVKLSGDQLKVYDQELINAVLGLQTRVDTLQTSVDVLSAEIVKDSFSRIVIEEGDITYLMYAEPGHLSGESTWQIRRIDGAGSRLWPNGDDSFTYTASAYNTYSYST